MTNTPNRPANVNGVGLSKNDYRGANSTLCAGCGHNSIANQIIAACYELDLAPETVMKFSGIGCSSKSPTYFLSRSFGFNSLHGRMPSVATGATFGDHHLKPLAVSGDGDTANIGMGQFKHLMRRNVNMMYIVENNGVYGLTKGQFSATAEEGLKLKGQGSNPYKAVDICLEALVSGATFIARSFAGDAKQVKDLIKAAISHRGIAILDIISPCVTFNDEPDSHHSYAWSKEHETPIHDITYVPLRDEITLGNGHEEGTVQDVTLHDGSVVRLKKLDRDYDPTSRRAAFNVLDEAAENNILLTGLIYIDPNRPVLTDQYNLTDLPLNRLAPAQIRPPREALDKINDLMF
ncbi:MAG: 2-oxoacid:ferredoxin oxidoreductase subunit beta [Anaerolineales bacterium]